MYIITFRKIREFRISVIIIIIITNKRIGIFSLQKTVLQMSPIPRNLNNEKVGSLLIILEAHRSKHDIQLTIDKLNTQKFEHLDRLAPNISIGWTPSVS